MPHDKIKDYILGCFPGVVAGGILLFGNPASAGVVKVEDPNGWVVLIVEYPIKLLMTAACGVISTLAINVTKDWYVEKIKPKFFKPKNKENAERK